MECQVVTVEQGTDEWEALRRCRITASRLADVMAGKETKRYRAYQNQLVMELLGKEFVDQSLPWFAHGKRLEPRAIGAYQFKFGQRMRHNIFLIHHKYDWFGCSPDMMPETLDEGVEVKCRSVYIQYRDAVAKAVANEQAGKPIPSPEHRHQIQGAMWMTGFDSWWYANYYEHEKSGTRKLHRIQVPRDDELIRKIEARSIEFMNECYEMAGLR